MSVGQVDANRPQVHQVTFDGANRRGPIVSNFDGTGKPGIPKGFKPDSGQTYEVVASRDKHNFYWLTLAQ